MFEVHIAYRISVVINTVCFEWWIIPLSVACVEYIALQRCDIRVVVVFEIPWIVLVCAEIRWFVHIDP